MDDLQTDASFSCGDFIVQACYWRIEGDEAYTEPHTIQCPCNCEPQVALVDPPATFCPGDVLELK